MKKFLLFCLLGAMAFSICAVDISLGLATDYSLNLENVTISDKYKRNTAQNFLGGTVFFDATYVRIGVGADFSIKGTNSQIDLNLGPLSTSIGKIGEDKDSVASKPNYKETQVDISILAKYPFKLGLVNLYPMLGFDIALNVSAKDGDKDLRENALEDYKKDLNHYYVVFGFGLDINFGKVYITPTASFGLDLKKASNYEKTKKFVEDLPFANLSYKRNNFLFNVGLGLGYRF